MSTLVAAAVALLLVLAVSRVLRAGLRRLRQPLVMAEVLAGVVLGASVLGALPGDPTRQLFTPAVVDVLKVLGQVAAAGYLFRAGASMDVGVLRRCGRPAALVGVASFVVPFAGGVALAAVALDASLAPALFLGTAIAVTAFPVLVRIVDEHGLAGARPGRVAIAAAAGQELVVWPLVAVALALDAGTGAVRALVIAAAAAAGVLALARWVPARLALPGLAAAAVLAELGGLHVVLGAFLYGAALPAGRRDVALGLLRTRVARAADALFLPLFFALPALGLDVGALAGGGLALVAGILVVAVATKLGSAALAALVAGFPTREALTIGALMNTRGLVELVVVSIGVEAGLIDAQLFAALVAMALMTTVATGPVLRRVHRPRAL